MTTKDLRKLYDNAIRKQTYLKGREHDVKKRLLALGCKSIEDAEYEINRLKKKYKKLKVRKTALLNKLEKILNV